MRATGQFVLRGARPISIASRMTNFTAPARGITMDSTTYFVLVSVAVFSGAVVSGLAGFAFSAVAGAILLHLMPPIEAVPLMMACSILVQVTSLFALMRSVQWKRSLVLASGGLLGIVPAVYLLQHVDTLMFRIGFGIFVASYSAYMLLRSAAARRPSAGGSIGEGLVGFGGGLIGGLTAMPGALPTIWCDLHGIPKGEQRGLVQPFIVIMQLLALTLLLPRIDWSSRILFDLAVSIPALAVGTAVGVTLFGRVNDSVFRFVVLMTLFISGLTLAL
jgi:uncharacterized protein